MIKTKVYALDSSEKSEIEYYIKQNTFFLLNFFNMQNSTLNIDIIIYKNIANFENALMKLKKQDYKSSMTNFTNKSYGGYFIHLLNFDLYKLIKSHNKNIKMNFLKNIIHEIVHILEYEYATSNNIKFLNEGIACYLSKQFVSNNEKITASPLNLINFENISYKNCFDIVDYIINTKGKNYLLELLNDIEFTKKEIPSILEEYNNSIQNTTCQ